MCVSCSRSLVSLSNGSASMDKSQLLKLCLRLASSMVMILVQNKYVNNNLKGNQWNKGIAASARQGVTRSCKNRNAHSSCVLLPSPPSYKTQGRWRSCLSCPARLSPPQRSPALALPSHTHLETTGQKRSTDGPPWNEQTHTHTHKILDHNPTSPKKLWCVKHKDIMKKQNVLMFFKG